MLFTSHMSPPSSEFRPLRFHRRSRWYQQPWQRGKGSLPPAWASVTRREKSGEGLGVPQVSGSYTLSSFLEQLKHPVTGWVLPAVADLHSQGAGGAWWWQSVEWRAAFQELGCCCAGGRWHSRALSSRYVWKLNPVSALKSCHTGDSPVVASVLSATSGQV